MLAVQTGVRAAELTGLRCEDIVLGVGAHVRCEGKGRKNRCTPLGKDTVGVLRSWMRERQGRSDDPVFPTTYRGLNCYTTRRLHRWLCKKHKVGGDGYTRYPDEYPYNRLGLIRLPRLPQRLPWASA